MTGRILAFPIAQSAPRERSYSFARVVVLLGLTEYEPRTAIETLRRLATDERMPLPKNPRYWAGKRQLGAASIGKKSVWDTAPFDAWLAARGSNDLVPARAAITHPSGVTPGIRAAMQQRARKLAARS